MIKSAAVASTIGIALCWSWVRHVQLPMGPSRLHWGGIVFGHRGCRNVPGIPENTLDAFKYAVSRGCGGIECDVRLTKDNQVVVFHDAFGGTLLKNFPPAKRIDELTLFELKECCFAADPTEQIRIPTLEESILFCRENNLRLLIEIKELKRSMLCTDKVIELYRRYPDYMYDNTTIISFHPGALYHARQKDRNIATGQIYSVNMFRTWVSHNVDTISFFPRTFPGIADRLLFFAQEKISPWVGGCSLICPRYDLYSETYRRRWHSRRVGIYLWGFADSTACTPDMRQPGVCVSADDHHEQFATAKREPDYDIFGDASASGEREEEARRKRPQLKQ
ncbi:glycerophosphoryl diester phosphodiesterase [Strigomonas culicis]|uniref:Glycerophosphoryl diester phosphodiesterase n=1 Tax=Strigomonas culicis TaxID=28005 RepID=S9VF46_9TRYP|nr:glycerophosphoryl diester phosphodiesterase [Strigomonas culicis]|eukprot:EPY25651.1 glycerophosphoryl diester phosphodiesterase [Strigomonas culicis]